MSQERPLFVQLARNTEAMGEELAQRAEASLRELATRVMEAEVEAEMSKLFLRTAIERGADDLVETRREAKVELAHTKHEMAELNKAQSEALQAGLHSTGRSRLLRLDQPPLSCCD